MTRAKELRFCLFTAFGPGGPVSVPWNHPGNQNFDYLNLNHQIKLAEALERARFDAIFWADFSGVHDTYQGSYDVAVRDAVQFPLGDPLTLAAALAGATEHLGLAFSSNMVQHQPYGFARRVATLDHLTRGRVGWNIVTSYQPSAWRNAGFDGMDDHARRYVRAQEYVDVVRKLLVDSWDDDAVVRDLDRKIFADPARVKPISHDGEFYHVPGIAMVEPSPQRMPVTFQAGSSNDGREFSARNAEAIFFSALNHDGARSLIDDMTRRLEAAGRSRDSMLMLQFAAVQVASTEAEVHRKNKELDEQLGSDAAIAFISSTMGTDFSQVDIDRPLADFKTDSLQGMIRALAEATKDKSWSFRDIIRTMGEPRMVGTPEQIADKFEQWGNAGVDGFNVSCQDGVEGTHNFLDQVVPILQERGLMQRDYATGTLRDKLFRGRSVTPLHQRSNNVAV